MNKNNKKIFDELRDVTKMTLNIQKLNWYNQELLMENCYYRHIIKQAIEYLKENARYTDNNEFVCDLRYDNCEELLDILKGSVDDGKTNI